MRALVLEDDPLRASTLIRKLERDGYGVTWVKSLDEARLALAEYVFDFATLDHDLGWGHGTGMDVALEIINLPRELRPKRVEVHSMNPAGAARMVQALASAGVIVTRKTL